MTANNVRTEKTIRKILDGANWCLENIPLKQFNTNRIAKASEVSIGSLYRYFKNKDELSKKLYEHLNSKSFSLIETKLPEGISFEKKIDLVVEQFFDFFMKHQKHAYLFARTFYSLNAYHFIVRSRRKSTDLLTNVVLAETQLKPSEAKLKAHVIVNSFLGVVHNHIFEKNDKSFSPEELKEELKDIIHQYLSPHT